jgi:hypothetical protein
VKVESLCDVVRRHVLSGSVEMSAKKNAYKVAFDVTDDGRFEEGTLSLAQVLTSWALYICLVYLASGWLLLLSLNGISKLRSLAYENAPVRRVPYIWVGVEGTMTIVSSPT